MRSTKAHAWGMGAGPGRPVTIRHARRWGRQADPRSWNARPETSNHFLGRGRGVRCQCGIWTSFRAQGCGRLVPPLQWLAISKVMIPMVTVPDEKT